ncbi:MAG TPA: TonB-dependent receptor [Terriglobales bacterium]|jgi:outer membrane receptor protein involved in Fe transport
MNEADGNPETFESHVVLGVVPAWRAFVLSMAVLLLIAFTQDLLAQSNERIVSGVVVDDGGQAVPGVTVTAETSLKRASAVSNEEGNFTLQVPMGSVRIRFHGPFIAPVEQDYAPEETSTGLVIHVRYAIAPVHESILITATALNPQIDQRNDAVYKNALFSRDDQVFDTLAAGINTGQHEGGGKSLEIRRFGFNLDHGGVNGGLKVLVNDLPQNQATQGHGQGYVGALKTLTPELVDDVDILNGPFSAEYGDFSGLGVVHIRLKETLPDTFMVRLQGGSFGAYRGMFGYSPGLQKADAFLAYEGSHTDGPFINPGRYARHNITGNYTRHLDEKRSLGFKLNFGINDFYSSGQVPLDLVASGQIDRFGFIDPFDGGEVRLGTLGAYYKRDFSNGDVLKVDGFAGRSLFDLYSNFTFFLVHYLPADPIHVDEIQQHDSRLQQGINTQYLHLYRIFGKPALLTVGSNLHDNQINVGLNQTEARQFRAAATSAHAHVTNAAGYVQQGADLLRQRLHFDAGLRFDYFRFAVQDRLDASHGGLDGASRVQPKLNFSFTPSLKVPLTLYASYGRGISSQDARGVVQRPNAPKVATTDFYQLGTSHKLSRFSLSTDAFLINRSNEQVYVPDNGSFELKGPSRSYGWEAKTSVQITRRLAFNGGFTQVTNAFYLGQPRVYVDSAPHSVANAGLTLADWRGFSGSLRYRHVGSYILDGTDRAVPRASGLDVLDLSMSKRIRHGVDVTFAIDNLNNKPYYETQNYFVSRVTPSADAVARVHGTPGFPLGVTVGMTFRFGEK